MTPEQIEAIKAIKYFAKQALEHDDVELLHKLFREIGNAAEKALPTPPR